MSYLIPACFGIITWVIIIWFIWKVRKESEKINYKKKCSVTSSGLLKGGVTNYEKIINK